MNENIEKMKAAAKKGKNIAVDRGRNLFRVFWRTLVENWESGIVGKTFLVASALILLWLIVPLFNGDEAASSDVETYRGGATPTAVLKRYYQAFFNGDLNGYISCLDNGHELDQDVVSAVADNFQRDDWREIISALYGTVSYGVPTWEGDGKMKIKVELENRAHGGSSTRSWSLTNINGAWFIDTQLTTSPFEMGL